MTKYVIDACIAAKWFLEEDHSEQARVLLQDDFIKLAPSLISLELANTLWKKVQFHDLTNDESKLIMNTFNKMPLRFYSFENLLDHALSLANRVKLTVYDALYLSLAIATDSQVVTVDKKFYKNSSESFFKDNICLLTDVIV